MTTSSHPARRPAAPLGHRFLTVWLGQTLSAIGSVVSGIGIAVYVFLQTDSAAWLGVLTALAAAPFALAGPFMPIVDRAPRRSMMMIGDTVAAAGPTAALVLTFTGSLQMWHLAVAAFLGGLGAAFQNPAAQAAVPLLVTDGAVDRANGLWQLGPAVGIVAGPLIATPLVAWWGLRAVLLVDVVTFVLAVGTVAIVRFDRDQPGDVPAAERGWGVAVRWLRGEGRPLLVLMGAGAVTNFSLSLFNVSLLALATDLGGAAASGIALAVLGLAMIVGALITARRGVGDDRIGTFAIGLGVFAVGATVAAVRPSFPMLIMGAAIAVVMIPALNAASATLYQERVPAAIQGRVFGVRGAVGRSLDPIGSVVAGFAISRLADPALSDDGALADSLGSVIGTGQHRGAAAVMLVGALLVGAIACWLARSPLRPALRRTSVTAAQETDLDVELVLIDQ